MIDALIQGFDDEVFSGFLNAKFSGSFSATRSPIPVKEEFAWESAEQLGIIKTLAGAHQSNRPLLIVTAKLPVGEILKERSSRIKQFKFAKQILDDAMSNPAHGVEGVLSQGLFVFCDDHGNFRLSLVFGKAEGTKLVWSTAKRLSFYVEAGTGNKTFRDRTALDWRSFDKLKEAFSVEKLTKEFYGKLFAWYQWALSDEMNVTYPNQADTDDDNREINEHIIRLITRLMFVWFLKQKRLIPDALFEPVELKKVLNNFDPQKGDNYYRAILQNLFFATLNSEIPERAFAVDAGNIRDNREHFDIKTLYRYGAEFSITQDEVLKLFEKIPFLNGGLFECLDRGRDYSDGFSRNKKRQAYLPNRLFFDTEKGLIPLLKQYHFTVEENSPGDEEVALDPELLGKVFENLLGAYNPETEVVARNATGSFYTPREIVNYMVDESLIAHVSQKVAQASEKVAQAFLPVTACFSQARMPVLPSTSKTAIQALFATGERPSDERLCKAIDNALISAKILDPACGSGAFPMGILLRMVELLRILRNISEGESVYDLKLELIENCIYGSDIQSIAVQITKLRFFISLVCEEGSTDIPVCGIPKGSTGIPACGIISSPQTRMSVLPSACGSMPPSIKITQRNLPHWKKEGAIYWITFRLADSIPQNKLKAWKEAFETWLEFNPKPWDKNQWKEYDQCFGDPFEGWLDAGMGSCALARPEVREALATCLLKFNHQRLILHSAVIMPNHVHSLIELKPDENLSKILMGIKGASARAANVILGTSGKFWMDESYDHIVRNEKQYKHFIRYIEDNPKEAKLRDDQYWLYKGEQDQKVAQAFLPVSEQTRMSALPYETQAGMPVLPCAANNYGIHTLPNLETKFVAADSLIGLPKDGDTLPMHNIVQMKEELWTIRHKHFLARTFQEKKQLRKKDKAVREKLAEALKQGGGFDTKSANLMAEWDPYDQNENATFFDPEWMFNVKDGFDVVIGNPPYVQIQKLPDNTKTDLASQKYKTFLKTADLYCLFYERGGLLLNSTGTLCYISSNKFFRSGYGKPLRQLLTKDFYLQRLIDFGELPVFEAGTDPVIVQFGCLPQAYFIAATIKHAADIETLSATITATGFNMNSGDLLENGWSLSSKESACILQKMRTIGTPLKQYINGEIYYGVKTGFNKAFILTDAEREALIAADPKSSEIIKPLAKGDDVRKWHIRKKGRWIILTKIGVDIKRYPAVFAHLKQWETELKKRQDQGNHWWELRACTYYAIFDAPKIVYPEIARESRFTLDDEATYPLKTIFSIPSTDKFLLGVLNSTCVWLFLKNTCSSLGDPEKGGRLLMQSIYLETLPIPPAPSAEKEVVSRFVDRILAAKKADPATDTSALEAEIDQLVYQLYGLTEEEIAIVEGNTGIPACEKHGNTDIPVCAKQGSTATPVCDRAHPTQTGMSVLPSKKKRKPKLPPSLPGWD